MNYPKPAILSTAAVVSSTQASYQAVPQYSGNIFEIKTPKKSLVYDGTFDAWFGSDDEDSDGLLNLDKPFKLKWKHILILIAVGLISIVAFYGIKRMANKMREQQ